VRQIKQRRLLDISQNAGIDIGRFYLVVEAVQRLASQRAGVSTAVIATSSMTPPSMPSISSGIIAGQQPDMVNRQLR